ncbi:MAG: glycosyltransferase family 2 protein [Sediminibacterium sp.]|nr:glycosyltransferase family 2 protein [Chitinophagaceae bacterium]MCA6447089.1 glycosyltransferase family 2 protein [Chitinophagaceae bacterium]
MRPIHIPVYIQQLYQSKPSVLAAQPLIATAYQALRKSGPPDVSIVMPAYNEEENILQTLLSIANNETKWAVEIVVVNNNSKDQTEALVKATGIPCITELEQGITVARNAGLAVANGKYILNADADTIYPKDWIEQMIKPLAERENIAAVYGRFSFIPIAGTSRFSYFIYEYFADLSRWINKTFRDEAMNAYGFNSGFRREEGLSVDGFNHPAGTNEDGWLALKLREKGYGKLFYVKAISALVWTTDRRIQIDGGLWKGTIKRIKRLVGL